MFETKDISAFIKEINDKKPEFLNDVRILKETTSFRLVYIESSDSYSIEIKDFSLGCSYIVLNTEIGSAAKFIKGGYSEANFLDSESCIGREARQGLVRDFMDTIIGTDAFERPNKYMTLDTVNFIIEALDWDYSKFSEMMKEPSYIDKRLKELEQN